MKTPKIALLITLVFILALVGIAQQTTPGAHGESLYVPVPQAERVSFREALELIVSLHKAANWSELYDYVDTRVLMSKEQFIKKMNRSNALIDFQPRAVTYIPPSDTWLVTGCAEFRRTSGKVFYAFSTIRGRHTGKGWQFRDVAIELLNDEPNGIRPCRISG